jgi:hypothetical protein
MKTKIKIISLFLILNIGTWITSQKAYAQVSVSFQVFYDELSPYGYWVDYPAYGYVWVPNVAPGFTPYATNGYWVFTDAGWTWVSNYPWGWAPFHYGRWYSDPMYGPMWVPDNEWGPGWVTWRRSEGYYGWAPMGPGSGYNVPNDGWRFVRDRDFGRRDINNYYVNSSGNTTIINNSTVINNDKGPERTEVEKHVGKTITPIAIKESSKPSQNLSNDQLQIYRPQVQKNSSTGTKPAPSKVTSLKELKPATERNAETPPQKANQPAKQPQPQQANPSRKAEGVKQTQQVNPPKNTGGEKQQQPSQQQHTKQLPAKQKPSQQQVNPPQKLEGEKQPQQVNPPKKMGEEKQPQHTGQPTNQPPPQPKQSGQPPQQHPSQPKRTGQPPQQQAKSPQNTGEEKRPY